MTDSDSVDGVSVGLMKQLHKLELAVLQGLGEQQKEWRQEIAGLDRRFQLELHKMLLDVNSRLDRIAKENAEARDKAREELASYKTDAATKRGEDYKAMFLSLLSLALSGAMAFAQFMGARLLH